MTFVIRVFLCACLRLENIRQLYRDIYMCMFKQINQYYRAIPRVSSAVNDARNGLREQTHLCLLAQQNYLDIFDSEQNRLTT